MKKILIISQALLLYISGMFSIVAYAIENPTGNPIGGGESYSSSVLPGSATCTVTTKSQLLSCLNEENRSPGDLVYIADSAVIDLTGEWNIGIPPGVTLASGRGVDGSLGAHIFTTTKEKESLFIIKGSGVRITGLRIEGPTVNSDFDGIDKCLRYEATGISAIYDGGDDKFEDIEIDNNEMWGWPHRAINLNKTSKERVAHVHHNHIHHNRRRETDSECTPHALGYGIQVDLGDAIIEGNLFNHNRHDIATTGRPYSSYEARYNLVVEGSMDHNFDVHGCHDAPKHPTCHEYPMIAGDTILIHGNTFWDIRDHAITVRGIPFTKADVYNNDFRHKHIFTGPDEEFRNSAIFQNYFVGNLFYEYEGTEKQNNYEISVPPVWSISFGGKYFWSYRIRSSYDPGELSIGDFDGDGAKDLLRSDGSKWYLSSGARESWEEWSAKSESLSNIRFGDFDGDGETDAFKAEGYIWYVSWSAKGSWEFLKASELPISQLTVGDFDGDGISDIWYKIGDQWYISWGGVSSGQATLSSEISLSELRFGDFDGDGRTDIFRTNGSDWFVSWGAQEGWMRLSSSSVQLEKLSFCDMNGDGATDVIRDSINATSKSWKVSYSAQTSWQDLRVFNEGPEDPPDDFISINKTSLADFNGDQKCDVLVRRYL
ncbi:FG-GAP repeat domain-containing protein [Microbulbifer sp. TYP-18]|uniref:FG-GAP repeat domain-containing protein n=1 Tax=Microbulbifer sp. TYP-18 TaxID=3230024 RepID=UPI0034C5CCA5